MSRFSPTVLPQDVDWGGILSQGINSFRQSRAEQRQLKRQQQHDQRAGELHELQAGAARDQRVTSRAQLLATPGVYTDENVPRLDGPAPSVVGADGAVAHTAPRPVASSARRAGQLDGVGNVYVDPDAQRRQLEGLLVRHGVEAPEAELRAATGKVDTAIDPRAWQPTSREEAEGFYASTQGDMSGRQKLEGILHSNRASLLDKEYGLRTSLAEREAQLRTEYPTGKGAKNDAFDERRKTIATQLFPNGIASAFHQELVDALADGESPAAIIQGMRAAGVRQENIQEAARLLEGPRAKRLTGGR